jgi:hypothetical protein
MICPWEKGFWVGHVNYYTPQASFLFSGVILDKLSNLFEPDIFNLQNENHGNDS